MFFPYVVAQSILNFVSTLPGEPGCEELCFEFEKLHSCLPGLPQVRSISLDVDLVYSWITISSFNWTTVTNARCQNRNCIITYFSPSYGEKIIYPWSHTDEKVWHFLTWIRKQVLTILLLKLCCPCPSLRFFFLSLVLSFVPCSRFTPNHMSKRVRCPSNALACHTAKSRGLKGFQLDF